MKKLNRILNSNEKSTFEFFPLFDTKPRLAFPSSSSSSRYVIVFSIEVLRLRRESRSRRQVSIFVESHKRICRYFQTSRRLFTFFQVVNKIDSYYDKKSVGVEYEVKVSGCLQLLSWVLHCVPVCIDIPSNVNIVFKGVNKYVRVQSKFFVTVRWTSSLGKNARKTKEIWCPVPRLATMCEQLIMHFSLSSFLPCRLDPQNALSFSYYFSLPFSGCTDFATFGFAN